MSDFYKNLIKSISIGLKKSINENANDDFEEINDIFNLPELIKGENDVVLLSLTSLRVQSEMNGYNGPFIIDDGKFKKLNESIERTFSYEEIVDHYRVALGVDPGFIKAQILANGVKVVMLIINADDNLDFLKEAMEQLGWSFSNVKYCTYLNAQFAMVSFDPMFQNPVNDEILNTPILFHWTPLYAYKSIIKNGLLPKSENSKFSYPPRIHLLKGNISDFNCEKIGKILCDRNKNIKNDGNYVLLNIDTRKIPYDIDYFYDPRYEFGYYTTKPICKEAITEKLRAYLSIKNKIY